MMDFVVGVPKNMRKYDSIQVIFDQLTKSSHFILVKVDYSETKLAKIYVKEIVGQHGVLVSIMSDKGNSIHL